jgi:hypothetical protein
MSEPLVTTRGYDFAGSSYSRVALTTTQLPLRGRGGESSGSRQHAASEPASRTSEPLVTTRGYDFARSSYSRVALTPDPPLRGRGESGRLRPAYGLGPASDMSEPLVTTRGYDFRWARPEGHALGTPLARGAGEGLGVRATAP